MRILVIGAGALGGYYGACLARAGRDVTFLVRPNRAAQLARTGLQVVSPHGDFAVPAVTIAAGDIREPFDLILVGVKSYSLDEVMEQFSPAVGQGTSILPLLNGIGHVERLHARFGAGRVLGGVANISAALDAEGRVTHLIPAHILLFGKSRAVRPSGCAPSKPCSPMPASTGAPATRSYRTCGKNSFRWPSAPAAPA